jgi:hypothetical protein
MSTKYKHKIVKGTLSKTPSIYNSFKELHGNKISKEEFIDICITYNTAISKLILYGSYVFKVPHLGSIYIRELEQKLLLDNDGKLVTNKLKVNYNATWKLRNSRFPGKTRKEIMELIKGEEHLHRVYHFNEHTDGRIFRWNWLKKGKATKNLSIYRFRPTKDNRRELPKIIKSNLDIKYYNHVK